MQITDQIKKDILSANGTQADNFSLIRSKNGVHVYKCTYNDTPAVVKYFENGNDKREIKNYRILNEHNIPTIKVFAYGKSSIIMEDISVSEDWRLGTAEDLQDDDVAKSLAGWYFTFHENGIAVPELKTLYCEYDDITEENIKKLCEKFPGAADTFSYILTIYDKLRIWIDKPLYTLAYNDFYWSNFIVRKDKEAALMFDYNLVGKGYRYSDIRNVRSSLSDKSGKIFSNEYNRLYSDKYNIDRTNEELTEKQIDDICASLFSLIVTFESDSLPEWAEYAKKEAYEGILLNNVKNLLE